MTMPCLRLEDLSDKYHPGLTKTIGSYMAEATTVCLDSQNHPNNVVLFVSGDFNGNYHIPFFAATDQMRRAHGDTEIATENGAYGVAILLISANTHYSVLLRSRKGTGFDFWLGSENQKKPYFQNKARLEVSGIRKGADGIVDARVHSKINQTKRSDGTLPAYIVVVEFGTPMAKVVLR